MYNNIGNKIKTLAQIVAFVEIILSVIIGLVLLFQEIIGFGLIILIFGPLIAWISSWLLYGFGELIESTEENKDINTKLLNYFINKDKDKNSKNTNLKQKYTINQEVKIW